ncbi:MAG: phosphoglucosamine mutase [Bacillota bacterium]
MGRLFGTDGVRGLANAELTPELAYQLGRAGAFLLSREHTHPSIVIGKDTRASGEMLEAALAAGICSVGADVWRLGVLPTPAVAFLTRTLGATAGVVISASHNPFADNGIKFFAGSGYKLPDAMEDEIEALITGGMLDIPHPTGEKVGRIHDRAGEAARYMEHARGTFRGSLQGLKLVVDCAYGSAHHIAPRVLRDLGADVVAINDNPDGLNINLHCGSTHPDNLQGAVVRHRAQLGLAFDGDADRVLAVDELGNLVDGDQIMVACGMYLHQQGRLARDKVIVTVMSNLGLVKAFEERGIGMVTTKVGDRYVMEEMLRTGAILGGEQSGHIIFLEHNTTGDGLITSLQLLQAMVDQGKSISELASLMQRYPQLMVNVPIQDKDRIMEHPRLLEALAKAEVQLQGRGRLLVRPSGTEPLIRIMAEGPDADELDEVVGSLARIAGECR